MIINIINATMRIIFCAFAKYQGEEEVSCPTYSEGLFFAGIRLHTGAVEISLCSFLGFKWWSNALSVEPRGQQMEFNLQSHRLDKRLALDFPFVPVVHNKTLKPGIAFQLYQWLYCTVHTHERSLVHSNTTKTCAEEVLLGNICAHIKIHYVIL